MSHDSVVTVTLRHIDVASQHLATRAQTPTQVPVSPRYPTRRRLISIETDSLRCFQLIVDEEIKRIWLLFSAKKVVAMLAPLPSPTNFERRSVTNSQASLSCRGSLGGTLKRGASLRHEPRPYVSRNPIKEEDLDVILGWESDNSDRWHPVKTVREGTVWKKELKEDASWVIKAELTAENVPFKKAVELMTEIKHRKEWDCLHSNLDVIETVGNFKVVYSQMKMPMFCKKREFLEAMSQRVSEKESNCYHMLAFRSTTHPNVPPSKDLIRGDDQLSGVIIRPVGDGLTSSKLSLIYRVKFRGSAPRGIKKSYLVSQSIQMVREMKKYYEKKNLEERIGKV